MTVHVNPYAEALAKFLQHIKRSTTTATISSANGKRLKPAAGVAAALAQVEGVFRVVVSCFVFVVLFALFLFTCSFPGLV